MLAPMRGEPGGEAAPPAEGSGEREDFAVRVTKDYLVFCCAHFITYRRDRLEPLHGHNYRAAFAVRGGVDENWYVLDFGVLKRIGRRLIDELDHRVLLARDNRWIELSDEGGHVEARCGDRRYRFPRDDVVVLPVANTTAEQIARHLADRLLEELGREEVETAAMSEVEVEVEETPGQSATHRRVLSR
jgi:6-pyruvoyltetrahydropterin/6-carboxytetrahydropterin synthase